MNTISVGSRECVRVCRGIPELWRRGLIYTAPQTTPFTLNYFLESSFKKSNNGILFTSRVSRMKTIQWICFVRVHWMLFGFWWICVLSFSVGFVVLNYSLDTFLSNLCISFYIYSFMCMYNIKVLSNKTIRNCFSFQFCFHFFLYFIILYREGFS